MGLLLTHKRKLTLWNDMLSVSGIGGGGESGGGKRGEIQVFSKASRYRLFRLLHQLTFERVTFITLTYPREFPTAKEVYKGHLKEYRRRFEIEHGRRQAVWRLEFQARGAPHFHIMYLDLPFVPVKDLCWMWKCVIHSWDMAAEINGVDLKLITDSKEEALIASYLSKYIAKVDETEEKNDARKCGRHWGKWNINEPDRMEFEVSDWQAERIVTFALGCRLGNQNWQPIDRTLCSVFGSSLGSSEFSQFIRGYQDFHGFGGER
jgi:hypothetical protein